MAIKSKKQNPGKPVDRNIMTGISIDCVVFGFDNGSLEVLLAEHAEGITKGMWALPGGWINKQEHGDDAAHRLLRSITNLDNIYLEQLKAFTDPGRYPLERVITIGYYALIKRGDYDIKAGFNASDARWCNIEDIPELAFDHNSILEYAIQRLRKKVRQAPVGFKLLPQKFTLLELMQLYEAILGEELDKPNFRRKFLNMKLLVALDEKQKAVSHRAAQLYEFDPVIYKKLTDKGFSFEF